MRSPLCFDCHREIGWDWAGASGSQAIGEGGHAPDSLLPPQCTLCGIALCTQSHWDAVIQRRTINRRENDNRIAIMLDALNRQLDSAARVREHHDRDPIF